MLLNEGTELDFRKIVLGKETKPNKKLWSYIEVKIKKNYKETRTAILCCLFRSALQNQLKYSVYTHSSFGLVLWFFSGRKPSDLVRIWWVFMAVAKERTIHKCLSPHLSS